MAKKNYPLGCLESGYDPRDYTVAFVGKYGKLGWPVSDEIPEPYDSYDQEFGTCVAQSLRYGPHRHYKVPFGVNFLYGLARAAAATNMPGMSMRTANDFFVKYGLAPLSADPKEYEVPTAVQKAKAAQDTLMKAAAPYIGWTYARLMSIDEIKAAIRDRRHITFRMEVSRNGLDKATFFRGDGKNGIGHHAMVILGYGPRVNARGVTVEAVKIRNSWGEDWGDHGCCYMIWEDVMIKNEIYAFFPPENVDPVPDPIIIPHPPLYKGKSGPDVLNLQKLLQKHGYLLGVEIKGTFGQQTREAVIAFQQAAGLDADGIVGPLTWAALEKEPKPVTPTPTPTNWREKLLDKVFKAGAALIGSDYSQSDRDRIYPGGKFDCSKFVQGVFAAAGVPLLSKGNELTYAAAQVDAEGFDAVYLNGGKKASPGLVAALGKPGDIVLFSFEKNGRKYNISHVAIIDRDGKQYIQTATNARKCERVPFNFQSYHKNVVAILRLRDRPPALPELAKGSTNTAYVRILQVALNIWCGERLVCDGQYGPKTAAAVAEVNAELGVTGETCTTATWAAMGFEV